jgi:hypothetical protein
MFKVERQVEKIIPIQLKVFPAAETRLKGDALSSAVKTFFPLWLLICYIKNSP